MTMTSPESHGKRRTPATRSGHPAAYECPLLHVRSAMSCGNPFEDLTDAVMDGAKDAHAVEEILNALDRCAPYGSAEHPGPIPPQAVSAILRQIADEVDAGHV